MDLITKVLKRCVPMETRAAIRRMLGRAMGVSLVRTAVLDLQDFADGVRGRRGPLQPPRKLIYGIGDGFEIGEVYLRHFRELAGLERSEFVLDIGCGVGRMAVPLTRFLEPPGRYDGLDIMPANVDWCRRAISSRFPHFRFQHLDVYSREYNPRGCVSGRQVNLPYEDESFDFVFLTSVFTHLLPEVAHHYLSEIARVLRPDGRCLATFFLLNNDAEKLIENGQGAFNLRAYDDQAWVMDLTNPEACIAIREEFI